MLLNYFSTPNQQLAKTFLLFALAFSLLQDGSSLAADPDNICAVQIPVYGATGEKLPFRIARVTPPEREDINLLSVRAPEGKLALSGDRLLFPKGLLGRSVRITLEDNKGYRTRRILPLVACRQRISFRIVPSGNPPDVYVTTAKGRLSGCTFSGDWWVRGMPMFGAFNEQAVFEGLVELDGTFSLSGSMQGERHLVVIGKDRQPVRTIAVNVVEGEDNDIGTVDLTGSCPK